MVDLFGVIQTTDWGSNHTVDLVGVIQTILCVSNHRTKWVKLSSSKVCIMVLSMTIRQPSAKPCGNTWLKSWHRNTTFWLVSRYWDYRALAHQCVWNHIYYPVASSLNVYGSCWFYPPLETSQNLYRKAFSRKIVWGPAVEVGQAILLATAGGTVYGYDTVRI